MAEPILNMVRNSDPTVIEKYVKYHLPNDPVALERIYKELLEHQFESQPTKSNTTVSRSQSLQNLTLSKQSKPSQVAISNKLLKNLRDRGLKVVGDVEEQGLSLYKTHKERLVKPLLTNSKLLKSEEAVIDRLIHRYKINRDFYRDLQLKQQKGEQQMLDPEMKDFLRRRQSLLTDLKKQNTHKIQTSRRFSQIESKCYNSARKRISFEKIPLIKISNQTQSLISSTKILMGNCSSEIAQTQYRTINCDTNHFRDLQNKIELQKQGQDEYSQLEDAKTFKNKIETQQFQRYTNSYIDMLTSKMRTGSKSKLSSYDKDLIRDAKKMRKIIDFSSK